MSDPIRYVAFKGKLLNLDLLKEASPTDANLLTLYELHQQILSAYERWNLTPALLESLVAKMLRSAEVPTAQPDPLLATKELEVLWHRVLENIQFPSHRALLRQLCVLLAFDECVAVIGTKSQAWEKHLRNCLPSIRAAFQQTCQKSVEVQLHSLTRRADR